MAFTKKKHYKILELQDRIINYTYGIVASLGTIIFFFLLIRGINSGFNVSTITALSCIIAFNLVFPFRKGLSAGFKVNFLIFVTVLILITSFLSYGYLAAAKFFVLGLPILISFQTGQRRAIQTMGVMLGIYAVFGVLYTSGFLSYRFDLEQYTNNPFTWFIEALVILIAGMGNIFLVNIFVQRITSNYEKIEKQNQEYQHINSELNCLLDELYASHNKNQALMVALAENENKYRLIVENTPVGIIQINRNGIISGANNFFSNLIGLTQNLITGNKVSDLFKPEVLDIINSVILSCKPVTLEGYMLTLNQHHEKFLRLIITPVMEEDRVDNAILLIEDLSENLKKTELERKIILAEESAKFKQTFLAKMSHEIRTPLTGILGMTDMLSLGDLDAKHLEYVDILKKSGENLREIINQVLEFSKLEAGKVTLNRAPLHFNDLLVNAETLFGGINKKKIRFSVWCDPQIPEIIVADGIKLTQIINNLISNAYKFTSHGEVKVKADMVCHYLNHRKMEIKISVSDTGMGINTDKQTQLFQPFSQLGTLSGKYQEGTGLGLLICKELACLHGGAIGLESTEGIGSTFWFTFEADELLGQREIEIKFDKQISGSLPASMKILLAEDQKVNQKVFKILFESQGHELIIAENGNQVIDIFQTQSFDLILMDIQMPAMDGLTACMKLRKLYQHLPPIIGLSAHAFEGEREKYMKLGFDEYLTKPLRMDELVKAWHNVTTRRQSKVS